MLDHRDLCVLYHSHELPDAERRAFETHRASCPACRELLEALALGSRAAQAALLGLPARARARSASEARGAPSAARPGAAVAVAIALALLALWPRGSDQAPSWRDMDRDIARLSAEVDRLALDIARSETDAEIDAELKGLQREASRLSVE